MVRIKEVKVLVVGEDKSWALDHLHPAGKVIDASFELF
jgi:hypothetical protein